MTCEQWLEGVKSRACKQPSPEGERLFDAQDK